MLSATAVTLLILENIELFKIKWDEHFTNY